MESVPGWCTTSLNFKILIHATIGSVSCLHLARASGIVQVSNTGITHSLPLVRCYFKLMLLT